MTTLSAILNQGGDFDGQPDIPEHLINAPVEVRKRVCALKKLHLKSVDVQVEFYKKVHELETQFRERFEALNKQRAQIVSGEYEPAENECDAPILHYMTPEDVAKYNENAPVSGNPVKGIPEFWLNVLRTCPGIAEMVQDCDTPILKHLVDITVSQKDDPTSFVLTFHFTENPYFTNKTLTKEYTLSIGPNANEDKCMYDGPSVISCKGCTIDWKDGKNVTQKVVKKKQRKGANAGRQLTITVPNESVFNFFSPPHEEITDDLTEDAIDLLNSDFEIGQTLRDAVIDAAVLYYTGEIADDEDFDFAGMEDEDEDDGDDEDEE